MSKLILSRHLESQWNAENRFSGWVDVPLSKDGVKSAKKLSKIISKFKIDVIYTSPLQRNRETVSLVSKHLSKSSLPVCVSPALNERHYGKLQGLNKDEMKVKYGEEQIKVWRRSWDQAPPGGESLKDVSKRVVPFFKKYAEKDLKKGKNVWIVCSHNPLRALIKYIKKINNKEIVNLEIKPGSVLVYDFDKNLKLKSGKS